jgi:hypothetical protein
MKELAPNNMNAIAEPRVYPEAGSSFRGAVTATMEPRNSGISTSRFSSIGTIAVPCTKGSTRGKMEWEEVEPELLTEGGIVNAKTRAERHFLIYWLVADAIIILVASIIAYLGAK